MRAEAAGCSEFSRHGSRRALDRKSRVLAVDPHTTDTYRTPDLNLPVFAARNHSPPNVSVLTRDRACMVQECKDRPKWQVQVHSKVSSRRNTNAECGAHTCTVTCAHPSRPSSPSLALLIVPSKMGRSTPTHSPERPPVSPRLIRKPAVYLICEYSSRPQQTA